MQENPIPAIENAELAARREIQQANDDKASLLRKAREKADQDFAIAVQNAQTESERILRDARELSETALAALDAQFEQEKADIVRRAAEGENAALSIVIGLIGGNNL